MRPVDGDKLVSIFANKKEEWRGNNPLPSNESLMWLAAMDITANSPTIDVVPLDKLCEWMADNVYLKDDTEGAWELSPDNWKKVLTKRMEEQDAAQDRLAESHRRDAGASESGLYK